MVKQSGNVANEPFDPEKLINLMIAENKSIITVQDLEALAPETDDEEVKKEQMELILRDLYFHEGLVPCIHEEKYYVAEKLFDNAEFLIVPDELEIENNILIPGHRFIPFMDSEVFASEVKIREVGSRKSQSFKEFSAPVECIVKHHLLMGSELLFDFFTAENEENMANARKDANPVFKFAVFDMQKFYKETNFTEGDALLVKVVDYQKGEFEFRLDSGKQRSSKKVAQYRAAAEQALERVTEEVMPGAPVVDAIRSMFANAPELLKAPSMSLDELLLHDSAFDIVFDDDVSTLVKRFDEDADCGCGLDYHHDCDCGHDHHHFELPGNITIGSGKTGSLEEMLSELYPMLNLVELDAILLDNLKNHDFDFNSFYSRCFGDNAIEFADGLQEACFFNELEMRFEELWETYPRDFDEKSGAVRSLIVDFTIDRCMVLTELAELSGELEIKPELFEALAEVVLLLDEALKLLNAPASLGDDFDYEQLRKGVEDALEKGEDALAALRGVFDGND